MNSILRREVLRAFKALHRARLSVFRGDDRALEAARQRINAEYKKYKLVNNKQSVEEMLALSRAVEKELRTSVVQATEVTPGKFKLKISPETNKFDNIPYKE